MLPFPSDVELPPPTQFEQFCRFLVLYLTLLGWTSLVLPRPWFVRFLGIAFPFLPVSLERFREDDHD